MCRMTFENPMTAQVVQAVREGYGIEPEFLWRASENAAFRHRDDKRWFGVLLMHTPYRRLGLACEGSTDVLDVKCDPLLIGSLLDGRGILPGYHMNKEHWISILLDGSVPMEKIVFLLDASYDITLKKEKKRSKKQ